MSRSVSCALMTASRSWVRKDRGASDNYENRPIAGPPRRVGSVTYVGGHDTESDRCSRRFSSSQSTTRPYTGKARGCPAHAGDRPLGLVLLLALARIHRRVVLSLPEPLPGVTAACGECTCRCGKLTLVSSSADINGRMQERNVSRMRHLYTLFISWPKVLRNPCCARHYS